MTSPIQKNGAPLSTIFAPYVSGTKAAATGLYENGTDLCNLYAPISAGPAAPATGIKCRTPLVDLNTIFSAPTGALGFNGQSYTRSRGRGTAVLNLNINNDGTWNITTDIPTTLASGTWFNFGGAISDYTVQFVMTGFSNGPSPDGGSDTFTNGAPSASSLTTSRTAQCTSSATTINTDASNNGQVQVNIYKSGSLVSISTCSLNTSATGT